MPQARFNLLTRASSGPNAVMPVIRGGKIASETNRRGMEFPCQIQDFRVHAIHSVIGVQANIVHKHASIAFERDHQIDRFKRRHLAGLQLKMKCILCPGIGWGLYYTCRQHLRWMRMAAQRELYPIVPTNMLQPDTAAVLQLAMNRQVNLFQYAPLPYSEATSEAWTVLNLLHLRAWSITGSLCRIKRLPRGRQAKRRCGAKLRTGFPLCFEIFRRPESFFKGRILHNVGPESAISGMTNRLQKTSKKSRRYILPRIGPADTNHNWLIRKPRCGFRHLTPREGSRGRRQTKQHKKQDELCSRFVEDVYLQ